MFTNSFIIVIDVAEKKKLPLSKYSNEHCIKGLKEIAELGSSLLYFGVYFPDDVVLLQNKLHFSTEIKKIIIINMCKTKSTAYLIH